MNSRKAYTIDHALVNRHGFSFSESKGRIIENIVYIELLRRRKEVYYFSGKNECDFLVMEGLNVTHAIQVCYQLDIGNREREYNGLIEAMQCYNIPEGILITAEQENPEVTGNISTVPVWKWLLTERYAVKNNE